VHLPEPDPDEDTPLEPVGADAATEVAVDEHGEHHGAEPHESPWIMVVPMAVLAVFAIFIGVLNLPFSSETKRLEHWLEPVLAEREVHIELPASEQWALALGALVLVVVGIFIARWVYLKDPRKAKAFEPTLFANAWYLDRGISAFVAGPGRAFFDAVAWFDRTVVDGAVNGAAYVVRGAAVGLRRTQSGFVRTYALVVAIGAVVVIGLLLSRAGW
jgi:NADH-quinone oxidoreductase subunit L